MKRFQQYLSLVAMLSAFVAPNLAYANTYEFCFRFVADMIDGNIGEDYYKTTNYWKARGAKIVVYAQQNGQSVLVYDGYAGRNTGCREVTTSFTGATQTFSIFMFPQARVHKLSSGTYVYVKAKSPTVSENTGWLTQTQHLAPGGTYYINSASNELSRLMAVGDYSVYRWFKENTGFPSNQGFTMWMENDNCGNDPANNWACADDETIYVPTADQRTQRKFLIGHEVGHFMYQRFIDDSYPFRCLEDPDENAACKFHGTSTSTSHALQMKVPNSCALGEGFAHFFATDVFNAHSETAYFDYYKESYPGKVAVESGPTGGDTAYMENVCINDDKFDGWSTELDWLRLFWDYHTDPHSSSSKPSHEDIVRHMKDAHDLMWSQSSPERYYNAYDAMMDSGSSTSSFRARFDADAAKNGADY